jgi:hypothetical protein
MAERPPPNAAEPAEATNALSILTQTAALVEGEVTAMTTEYTEETGPWTRIDFSKVKVHRGSLPARAPSGLSILQKGGDYPDGRRLHVSDMPTFAVGKRYVIFLRNTAWSLSPVVGLSALRVEAEGNRELLIGAGGGALEGFSSAGMGFSRALFSTPGRHEILPAKLPEAVAPAAAMGVNALLAQVDAQLSARGLALSGKFFDEPVTRSRHTAVVPSNGAQANVSDENAPGTDDTPAR